MARLYATQQDVRDYTGDQGGEWSPRELANAARFIESAVLGAWYVTDTDGKPTDAATLAALREATCELLASRADDTAGDQTGEVAALRAAGVKRASVNGASYELADDVETTDVLAGAVLPVTVWRILSQAGLVGQPALVVG